MTTNATYDVVVIGGGIMGLSLAFELGRHDLDVLVVDRRDMGREASWAGAGIVPPGSWYSRQATLESAAGSGRIMYPSWCAELRELTGIDTGWRICGGIYTRDRHPNDAARTAEKLARWAELNVEVVPLSDSQLEQRVGRSLSLPTAPGPDGEVAYLVEEEAQVRNPRLLRALIKGCQLRGVRLMPQGELRSVKCSGPCVEQLMIGESTIAAGAICLATGCWTSQLGELFDWQIPVRPVRGQMLLLGGGRNTRRCASTIHHEGRYVVHRDDGRVLVGSTMEEVGFDKSTTDPALASLHDFAGSLGLSELAVETSWAGLRPVSVDGQPIVGRLPSRENVWVATGHGRSGIQFAPATAAAVSALVRGAESPINIDAWAPDRF